MKKILRSQKIIKSEAHSIFTEKVNKITLSANEEKALLTCDKVMSYPYGKGDERVCKVKLIE